MQVDLRNRNVIALKDFSEKEILYLIDEAARFKDLKAKRKPHKYLEGQNIILLFEQSSNRTRTSFEVAGFDLGLGVSLVDLRYNTLGTNESLEDAISVYDRYYDGIVYRGPDQKLLEYMIDLTDIPIYNALTDKFHPSQMIADMLTIREKFGRLEGLKLVYLGYTGDNMPSSLAITCAKLGINFVGCGPLEYAADKDVVSLSNMFSKNHHSDVIYTDNVKEAVKDADIIYTDMWIGLNEKDNVPVERIKKLYPFRVTQEIMDMTKEDSIFMHCLPAFHDKKSTLAQKVIEKLPSDMDLDGMEVADEVFRSEKSMVFDQTENRIGAVKAILYSTLRYE